MGTHERRVAIVTGGASGIGQAIVEELSRRGATVVVADRDRDRAEKVADSLTAQGRLARAYPVDVADEGQVAALVSETVGESGRLDTMVNCAGVAAVGELDGLGLDRWRNIVGINLWGVVYGCYAAYPVMRAQGFGHIVNVASAAGLIPSPVRTAYATTKYGVVGLSLTLRLEAAVYGVKVGVVCPGLVRTPIFAKAEVAGDPELVQRYLSDVKFIEPYQAAERILAGMARDRAVITLDPQARLLWRLWRLSPALTERVFGRPGARRLLAQLGLPSGAARGQ